MLLWIMWSVKLFFESPPNISSKLCLYGSTLLWQNFQFWSHYLPCSSGRIPSIPGLDYKCNTLRMSWACHWASWLDTTQGRWEGGFLTKSSKNHNLLQCNLIKRKLHWEKNILAETLPLLLPLHYTCKTFNYKYGKKIETEQNEMSELTLIISLLHGHHYNSFPMIGCSTYAVIKNLNRYLLCSLYHHTILTFTIDSIQLEQYS